MTVDQKARLIAAVTMMALWVIAACTLTDHYFYRLTALFVVGYLFDIRHK